MDDPGYWSAGEELTIPNLGNRTRLEVKTSCDWMSFPSAIFSANSTLLEAEIDCDVRHLAQEDFLYARNLVSLRMEGNKLQRIERNTFVYLMKLVSLFLVLDEITVLEDRAFHWMRALETLDLSYNNLTTLGRETFAGASELRNIDLCANAIKSIKEGTFDLTKLETLNIAENRLTTLRPYIFANPKTFSHLFLHNNHFTDFPREILRLSSLEHLTLDGNPLKKFKLEDLVRMLNLKSVSLMGTEITLPEDVPEMASNVSKLVEIKLTGKELTTHVLQHLSAFPSLERITLGYDVPIMCIKGIENIQIMFPNVTEIVLMGDEFACEFLKEHKTSINVDLRYTSLDERLMCILSPKVEEPETTTMKLEETTTAKLSEIESTTAKLAEPETTTATLGETVSPTAKLAELESTTATLGEVVSTTVKANKTTESTTVAPQQPTKL